MFRHPVLGFSVVFISADSFKLRCCRAVCIVVWVAAGWSSSVARRAHNPEVAGSNPVPATRKTRYLNEKSLRYRVLFCPDETESLCYSLPFSQTQARRRGGGRGDYHPTSRTIIQRPFGAYDYLRSCMISWEGGCRGGFSPPNRR